MVSSKETQDFEENGYSSQYDVPAGYKELVPEKPITSMTVKEVMAFQQELKKSTKGKWNKSSITNNCLWYSTDYFIV